MDRNIDMQRSRLMGVSVVPRKGDVDRNQVTSIDNANFAVVPRKGDVDRNGTSTTSIGELTGRPPQGGRG